MDVMWFLFFLLVIGTLSYQRASLHVWAVGLFAFMLFKTALSHISPVVLVIEWIILVGIFAVLYSSSLRRKWLTSHILSFYKRSMPNMSRTEREALSAGTVGWEGDLFKGNPNWDKFLAIPKPELTAEECAFIEGPVEELCAMLDDWDITHRRADLPPEVWSFLKEHGFFGLIIPKEYGGKAFSAYAHSQILTKVYGRSITAATTISVPNSLGPAELLLHYGTPDQKNYYLPRLAKGAEVPCFALTGPEAGSDAGAMTDKGIIGYGEYLGQKVLGITLNFDKRYITLAPVATVIGLAFKLYDPDHLLGEKKDLGITCALIPRDTAGITIGRRHFPANVVFQNGPIKGKNVFIPLDWIIGGPKMAGQGWRMLMECLAAGRAISLPSSSMGGAKALSFATGAYARVRRQFNVPIGRFEGIEEALGRIGGFTYMMDGTRKLTASIIDMGGKPAVGSAITKYHVTELGRITSADVMDIHGGKGICLGPSNYMVRFYESSVIAITVEGANILTRNMIIFGQGAMRCHPYIFAEFEAARMSNPEQSLIAFDKALMGHLSFLFSNFVRSLVLGLTGGLIVAAPHGKTRRYFQSITRFSSAFALLADMSLLILGGELKRKESLSARLGDILSYLYILSGVLKQYHDQGKHAEDLPLVHWASQYCLWQIQEKFTELLKNFPNRFVSFLMHLFIFPLGKHCHKPSDRLTHKVANLLLAPTAARYRLAEGAFITPVKGNAIAELEDALIKAVAIEPLEKILKVALHEGNIKGETLTEQAQSALEKQIINQEDFELIQAAEEAKKKVIAVDDFTSEELMHGKVTPTKIDVHEK